MYNSTLVQISHSIYPRAAFATAIVDFTAAIIEGGYRAGMAINW